MTTRAKMLSNRQRWSRNNVTSQSGIPYHLGFEAKSLMIVELQEDEAMYQKCILQTSLARARQ